MKNQKVKIFIIMLSFFAIISGGLGMIYCAPYLWSNKLEDLVGAGFPFVGGSILFGSGLLSLSISYKPEK